jgi:peroxiredoxin
MTKNAVLIGLVGVGLFSLIAITRFTLTPRLQTAASKTALIGAAAPDFAVTSIDGTVYSSQRLKGSVVILFAFFAGCGECVPEAQALTKIRREYQTQGVEVIAVDILNGELLAALRDFQSIDGIDLPLVEYEQAIITAYKLKRPDLTYIIDREGVIRYEDTHSTDYVTLKQALTPLL